MAQLFCTKLEYADFCVWNPRSGPFIQRFYPNQEIFHEIEEKCPVVFSCVILPELKCQYFTRRPYLLLVHHKLKKQLLGFLHLM